MRILLPLAAAVLPAATAGAQLALGSIADANVVYQHTSFSTSISSTSGLGAFRATGPSGTDHLYQTNWMWRLAGDPREYAFHDGAGQGALSSVYSGNRVVHSWADVDLRGIAAARDIQVFASGATSGFAVEKMTVVNNTGAPISLNLFAYADVDVCASPAGDSAAANPAPTKLSIRDPGCTTVCEVFAPGADHYEVAGYPAVRAKLLDALFDDLRDTGLPFVTGDFTAAWQWQDRLVPPGGSFTAYMVLAIDSVHSGCTSIATAATYGAGKAGSNGVPGFDAAGLPLLGSTAGLTIRSGLAGATPFFILGGAPASIPFPPFGTILVDPPGAALFAGTPFDPSHRSRTTLTIPNVDSLCGAAVHAQAFIPDPAAVASVSHTDGLTWVLGGVH